MDLKISLSTFSVADCKLTEFKNPRLQYCHLVEISDLHSTLKGYYSGLPDERDGGIFATIEKSQSEIEKVFEVGDEEEFFKRVAALSEGYPVYLLKRNGSLHRIKLDLTIEPKER